MNSLEQYLQEHGIRPTAVRAQLLDEILKHEKAFTLNDMEDYLPHMDRSSIFRSLKLFAEHHILHEIDDGSGFQKYCFSQREGDRLWSHVHFTCRRCGSTICLKDIRIPHVTLPEGLVIEESEYIVKGLCTKCSHTI